jgi:hypothetical protein
MIKQLVWLSLAVGVLASCGNVSGKPLPLVDKNDPTFALAPDHLDYGALPK